MGNCNKKIVKEVQTMKYSKQLVSCTLAICLLSACSADTGKSANNGDNGDTKSEQTVQGDTNTQNAEEKTDTDEEKDQQQTAEVKKTAEDTTNSSTNNAPVTNEIDQTKMINAIKKEIKTTGLPVKLPTFLPLKDGKYLTATTKVEKNNYLIVFYESDKKLKVNDSSLSKAPKKSIIAKYKVVKYNSLKKANEVISYEDFSKVGGQKMNLGHQIIGYQDAGAGALWTSWNEGRWALATHTRTTKPDQGLELAKQAVEFLETNTLPIPKPNGSIHLDAIKSTENNVKWQNKNIVFSVEKVKDPIDALKIATSVK